MYRYLILTMLLIANTTYGYSYDHDPLGLNNDYVRKSQMETYQNLNTSQQQSQNFIMNNMYNSMNSSIRPDSTRQTGVESYGGYTTEQPLYKFGGY